MPSREELDRRACDSLLDNLPVKGHCPTMGETVEAMDNNGKIMRAFPVSTE